MKHPIIAATATALGVTAATATLAETTLAYGSWAPSSDPASKAFDTFSEAVADTAAVRFDTFYDGSVVGMRTVLGGIEDGLVDVGYVAGAIYQAEMPIDSMLTQFSVVEANPLSISAAVTDFILNDCDDCRAEAQGHGVLPLAYAGTPHFYLMCKDPIASFDDLKGESIRAASANLRFVNFIGATPVNTPTTEVMEAIQRGQVECAVGSIFWLQAYSLWDSVGYVLDLPMGQYNNGLVFGVNEEIWNDDLDDDARAAILGNLPTLVTQAAANGIVAADAIRAESIERGVVWGEPTDEMRATMAEWFASERASVQKWGEDHGVTNAATILDGFVAKVAHWNARVGELNGDADAVRAELAETVYAGR
ncbi:hypothetical protein [Mameliella sediminis]|uniref:hypothetical protein n=1 Tax=Mameliella sediminis TaxID=2836866 RepID=UPI001C451220|nr:hypothetical protein [Mameliella sediminis]MBV7392640.1 hypothetical protein [Mameliella sediminis]